MGQSSFFSYTKRSWDPVTRTGSFCYETTAADGTTFSFVEKVAFPHDLPCDAIPSELFERLLDSLHLMLGISYFKLYCPPEIRIPYNLTPEQAGFWNTVYRKGLGEFAFRNNLDLRRLAFPATGDAAPLPVDTPVEARALVGIGGGKDSIVALELLRDEGVPAEGFVVETGTAHDIAQRVCEAGGVTLAHIVRTLDPKVLAPPSGSFKGHIPISAVYAFLGYISALARGRAYVVTGNEWSSNFGNVTHHGEEVNHQWSKSMEFEQLFTNYANRYLSPSVRYFSIVRPLHEIRIAELFARHERYFDVFTGCNRKFRIDPAGRPGGMWCGECPKCAFVFLMLAPFIPRERLVAMFGKNMLDDPGVIPLFADILGFGTMKPFDCVGTFDEARAALHLVREAYADSAVVRAFAHRIESPDELVKSVMRVARAPSVPQRFRLAGMRNALLLGYGTEGKATKSFLRKHYPKVAISRADQSEDAAYLSRQTDADIVIKTAGIPKERVTAHYTTATNIFFSRWQGRTVGVTGSKGKSTTASLVHAMLVAAGVDARFVGNIGSPMLALLDEPHKADTVAVVELSSYQLDDIEFSPDIAVATSLFPEHMDYHGGFESYVAAKRRITAFQTSAQTFIYDPDAEALARWARETRAQALPFIELPFAAGSIRLLGEHNIRNVRAAATAARLLGVTDAQMEAAVASFQSLPHRLQDIGTHRGIRFYDDAISTTPESTIAAIRSIPDIGTIFLGGHDRGYDFAELERVIRDAGIRTIVLFPESGKRIFTDRTGLAVLETSDMNRAVAFAYAHTPAGKACVLSCASPSYGLWKNFEEKGDAFKRAVHAQSV